MGLPTSRDQDFVDGASEVPASVLHNLQDSIVAHERALRGRGRKYLLWEDFDALINATSTTDPIGPRLLLQSVSGDFVVQHVSSPGDGVCGEAKITKTTGTGTTHGGIGLAGALGINPGTRDVALACKVRVVDPAKLDILANSGLVVKFAASTLLFKADAGGMGTGNWKITNDGGTVDSGVAVATDTYQQLLAFVESGIAYFYIDGSEIVSARHSSASIGASSPTILWTTQSVVTTTDLLAFDYFGFSVER